MVKPLYESRAQGGPLDGVWLGAGMGWDGKIIRKRTDGHDYYHQGYYGWEPIKQVWIWHALAIPPTGHAKRRAVGQLRSDAGKSKTIA